MNSSKPKRQTMAIDSVIGNPRNDNLHPRSQIDLLVESIRKFGQPRPILARAANRMIIAGHGVWQAMREAGMAEIDVLLWDVNQRTADGYLLADNRFHELSHSDPERRGELLSEFDAAEFAALGFLPAEVEALLKGPDPLEVQQIDTAELENDYFWIGIRGRLVHQARALQLIQQVMAEIPEIEVDIGTTTGFG